MQLEKMNEAIVVMELLQGSIIDIATLREAEERYLTVCKTLDYNDTIERKTILSLERTFLDYIELLKVTFFQLGNFSKELEEYNLENNPFKEAKKRWKWESMTEQEREQEQARGNIEALATLSKDNYEGETEEKVMQAFETLGLLKSVRENKKIVHSSQPAK